MSGRLPRCAVGRFIGEQIRLRVERGSTWYNQATLAAVLGKAASVVSELSTGRRRVSTQMAIDLGDALDVEATTILKIQSDEALAELAASPAFQQKLRDIAVRRDALLSGQYPRWQRCSECGRKRRVLAEAGLSDGD